MGWCWQQALLARQQPPPLQQSFAFDDALCAEVKPNEAAVAIIKNKYFIIILFEFYLSSRGSWPRAVALGDDRARRWNGWLIGASDSAHLRLTRGLPERWRKNEGGIAASDETEQQSAGRAALRLLHRSHGTATGHSLSRSGCRSLHL